MEAVHDEDVDKLKRIQDGGLGAMKEYYIAYVDILGYTDFFRNRKNEIPLLFKAIIEQIQEVVGVNCIFRYMPDICNIDFQVKKKFFSDNLLLCLEKSNSKVEMLRVLMFVRLIADIQRRCLRECGVLLRGGITQGEMLFNDEFVFGEGVIKAVEMERSAKNPRVTISKELVEFMSQPYGVTDKQLKVSIKERITGLVDGKGCGVSQDTLNWVFTFSMLVDPLISIDIDGCPFVNYLYSSHYHQNKQIKGQTLLLMMVLCKEGVENIMQFAHPNCYYLESMKKIKDKLTEALTKYGQCDDISEKEEASKNEYVLKKYLWTLTHYNNICTAYGLNENVIYPKGYVKNDETF